jgi:hypothetical protein
MHRKVIATAACLIAVWAAQSSFSAPARGEEGTEPDAPADEPHEPGSAAPSYSIDCTAPCIQYEGDLEIENDVTIFDDPESATTNDFYPAIDFDVRIRPLDWLMFSGHIVTESVLDLEPGEDRFVEDVGTYAEELNVQVLTGDVQFIAGKFHPAFGLGWEIPPGLFATELAGEYELIERIGAGIAYRFSALGMDHHLQASAFTVDRTILGGSLFTSRERIALADGGAGNTDGLSSLALAVDACAGALPKDCIDDGDWGYHLAVRYQRAGASQRDDDGEPIPAGDEKGAAAALYKSFTFADETRLTLFGEAAYFADFEATRDNAAFLTATAILNREALTYSLTYSNETRWVSGGPDIRADLVDVSVDYEFDDRLSFAGERWTAGPGYAFIREDEQGSHWLGIHLKAEFDGIWPAAPEDERDE